MALNWMQQYAATEVVELADEARMSDARRWGGPRGSPLAEIKDFMAQHNAVIMMVVLAVLGAKLLGAGFAGVTT